MNLILKRIYFLLLLVFFGCLTDYNPVIPENYIDPEIFGDWYRENQITEPGRPDFSISGFQITEEGYMYNLGVDIQRGSLEKFTY